jgi:hypothetical protein
VRPLAFYRAEPDTSSRLPRATYVAQVIPVGFAAYARVLHPARRAADGARVRWAEVAAAHGRVAHAEMQWHAVAAGRGVSAVAIDPPEPGRIPPDVAATLVEVLRPFTACPADVWFAVWEGWGSPIPLVAGVTEPDRRRDGPSSAWTLPGGAARLDCPDRHRPLRSYRLYRGSLDAAVWLAEHADGASLWWPSDRSWCVATEVDLAWTYVGGDEALIGAVLADARLEAFRATPDHRADAGGDRHNA